MNEAIISEAVAAEVSKLAPEAKVTAREQLGKHYSPREIERVFGANATAMPQGNSGQEQTPAPRAMIAPDDALDLDQTAKGLASLYKHGSPDMQARVLQQAKAKGIALEEITGGRPVAPEVLTRDEKLAQVPATFADPNGPPADASEYRLTYDPDTIADIPADELAALDADFKQAFRAAQVPVTLAQSVVDAITETAALYSDESMTPDARELKHREQGGELVRTFGSKGAEEIAALATATYKRLPESFRTMLDEQNALHSAKAQVALANVERSYRARRKS